MPIITASGTKIEIGGIAADTVKTKAAYEALLPFTEIGRVESYGDFGDERAAVTFNSVGSGRIEKAKGSADAGTLALTVGYDPLDAGQIAVEAALASIQNFAFRVTFPDGSIQYFRGLVMSKRRSVGSADNVIKRVFSIGINSELLDVPAPVV
jgi:hypothetical protein